MSILATWPKHVELATTNGAGMNGATVANTSIISPFGPVAAILIIGIQMAYRTRLYSRYVAIQYDGHPMMMIYLAIQLPRCYLSQFQWRK